MEREKGLENHGRGSKTAARGVGGGGGGKGSHSLPLPHASRSSQMPDMRHLTLSSCIATFRFTAGLSPRTSSSTPVPWADALSPSDVPFAALHLHHVIHCLPALLLPSQAQVTTALLAATQASGPPPLSPLNLSSIRQSNTKTSYQSSRTVTAKLCL